MNNTKILITGANGFVGKNLTAHLKQLGFENLYLYDRQSTMEELSLYCSDCEFVFHLAGVNRPLDKKEFYEGNTDFSATLIEALKAKGNHCPILVSSSIQAELDNDYGKSKKLGEDLFFSNQDNKAFVFRLYGVFGKWSKPNYNTVVATFMYNVIHDIPVSISDENHLLTLCYIDDVVEEIIACIKGNAFQVADHYGVKKVYEISLGELKERIESFPLSRK
ncbi:MAG: NAD-dependent epimerase/dehydratase family protein, partial [Oscillospiraceae bacterium]